MNESLQDVVLKYLQVTAEAAGFSDPRSLGEIIGAIIGTFLSFLGIIFLCLIMYGGFLWMTSAGNEQKVMLAKKTLTNSVIGLLIILSAYSITSFIFSSLQSVI